MYLLERPVRGSLASLSKVSLHSPLRIDTLAYDPHLTGLPSRHAILCYGKRPPSTVYTTPA